MNKIKLVILSFLMLCSANASELVLSEDNTLVFSNVFTGNSVASLMEKARKMDSSLKSGYPIYLFLYTPGGSVQSGLELIEYLNGINRPVHTVTLFSASMGFQAVQHLGERYILKYGILMSHKARGGFSGEFGGGFSQLDSRYGLWLRRLNMMDKNTVKRTKGKQTLESYRRAYAPELWLNGPEAVRQGYADKVVTIKCDSSLSGTFTEEKDYGFFSVMVKLSKCPIIVSPVGVEASLLTNKGIMLVKDFLNKNGKFGEDCEKQDDYLPQYLYGYGDSGDKAVTLPNKQERLCAYDKTLTLEKIKDRLEETKKYYNRDLKDHIMYSY